ncbi:hypothetical protein, partial [Crocosphaera watsonii]|uniref:hypothetical protein n=1 Tax=Crocosphaera watsonii TaxID=263511 RepID=UPI0006517C59
YISKLLKIKSDVGILKPYVLNNQDYNFVSNSSYETGYKYEAKDSYFNPPYLWSHETIKRKLITLGEDFINQLQQKQNNKINQLRKVFKVCDNDFSTKRNLLLILYLLTILINNTSHSIESRSLENFSTGDPPDIYGYQFSKKGFASERVFCIEIDYVVKLEHEKYSKYYHDIFIQLDNISKTKLFSSIAYQINDFDRILKGYENLSTEEFCKQVYQQTVKSFQDEPEKLEIILADFYKLTQEAIFKSNTNILTTAQTTFIESKLQENKNNLEIKIHLTGSFPEPITGIFIASNQINTDTELNFFTTEDSLRSINQEDITTYQNQLFKEVFSETIEANKVLFLANCLKMTFKDSKNNQYSGILATNDKGHQIKYKLTPIQQNKYNLELESPQFNWKHDYQISLNNPNHVNFLHRLDSDLVEFILSLTDEETVLKKAITLTPHPEAENYNSGYLTTPNGNNRI